MIIVCQDCLDILNKKCEVTGIVTGTKKDSSCVYCDAYGENIKVKFTTEFEYKIREVFIARKEAIRVAKDLLYSNEVIEDLKNCKVKDGIGVINRILANARHSML